MVASSLCTRCSNEEETVCTLKTFATQGITCLPHAFGGLGGTETHLAYPIQIFHFIALKWRSKTSSTFNICFPTLNSSTRDDRAGFGGLLRSSAGNWIRGYSDFIPHSSEILYAELTALFHGLSLARSMNFTDVICYSDSLLCVKILHESTPKFHKHAALIQDIKKFNQPKLVVQSFSYPSGR
ncbi:ribonuclease H [Trifolium pratense]|uniref:Ribonuclease H n=1 Tax=Trifolium pratense TaxID=57577 RepID=A0A2K3L8I3_TRIPR|nr:ribonuclease H [Trifolium pratense]